MNATGCRNCGWQHDRLVRGLCGACRIYERRHGCPRDPTRMRKSTRVPAPQCKNCKKWPARGEHGLCKLCKNYLTRTGRNRPTHRRSNRCKVCGREKGRGWAKGRCASCYDYWRRHGVDRTRRQVKLIAPLGWCDCGRPAAQVMTLVFGEEKETYALCQRCADLALASAR